MFLHLCQYISQANYFVGLFKLLFCQIIQSKMLRLRNIERESESSSTFHVTCIQATLSQPKLEILIGTGVALLFHHSKLNQFLACRGSQYRDWLSGWFSLFIEALKLKSRYRRNRREERRIELNSTELNRTTRQYQIIDLLTTLASFVSVAAVINWWMMSYLALSKSSRPLLHHLPVLEKRLKR